MATTTKTPQERARELLPLALDSLEQVLRCPSRNAMAILKAATTIIELAQDRKIGSAPEAAADGELAELPPGVPPPPEPDASPEEWALWRTAAAEAGYRRAGGEP